MLLLAVLPILPYWYYTLLRIVVCGASWTCGLGMNGIITSNTYVAGYIVSKTYVLGHIQAIVMMIVAISFNPLIPIYLSKAEWSVIDIIVAVYFILTRYRIKRLKINHEIQTYIRNLWEKITNSTLRKITLGAFLCAIGIVIIVDGFTHQRPDIRRESRHGELVLVEYFGVVGVILLIPGCILVIKGAKEYWSE
jgi:uncharacterized membrane protein YidH (DUF202 family)